MAEITARVVITDCFVLNFTFTFPRQRMGTIHDKLTSIGTIGVQRTGLNYFSSVISADDE